MHISQQVDVLFMLVMCKIRKMRTAVWPQWQHIHHTIKICISWANCNLIRWKKSCIASTGTNHTWLETRIIAENQYLCNHCRNDVIPKKVVDAWLFTYFALRYYSCHFHKILIKILNNGCANRNEKLEVINPLTRIRFGVFEWTY